MKETKDYQGDALIDPNSVIYKGDSSLPGRNLCPPGILVHSSYSSTGVSDKSKLIKLISGSEDPFINVNDLAFLLVTHDFDAIPKGDYVEVRLNNTIYKLVPNGRYPGLANVTIES